MKVFKVSFLAVFASFVVLAISFTVTEVAHREHIAGLQAEAIACEARFQKVVPFAGANVVRMSDLTIADGDGNEIGILSKVESYTDAEGVTRHRWLIETPDARVSPMSDVLSLGLCP